jgi:peptidoglycan/xylan/chitin deacetylase (PgdA/CDA1 family)
VTGTTTGGAVACFTFDNMGEAAEIGAGLYGGPRPGGDASLRHGYPNLYRLLDAHHVRATFFVEGWNGEHHPDAVAEVVRRGHELGMHGWAHEPWAALAPDDEAALARRATEALERAAGVRPRGFRAPGGTRTGRTGAVLRDLGYRYDASLGDDMRPGILASGLAQVPFTWAGVDGFHYLRREPARPADVRDAWLAALAAVAAQGGLFLLICHAFITGVDAERLAALDAVVHAAREDARVTIRTAGDVAETLLGTG